MREDTVSDDKIPIKIAKSVIPPSERSSHPTAALIT